MPYVLEERQKAIKNGEDPQDVGELNLYITFEIIRRWRAKPRYVTIHELRRDFAEDTKANTFLYTFHYSHRNFSWEDINIASKEAFHEFRNRVGQPYERMKALMNGDVYKDSVEPIVAEIKRLQEKKK